MWYKLRNKLKRIFTLIIFTTRFCDTKSQTLCHAKVRSPHKNLPPGTTIMLVDMTIHSPTVHSQAGKLNNSSAILKTADSQKNHKYDALPTKMGYKFIHLSATSPYEL